MNLPSNPLAFLMLLAPAGYALTAVISWFYPGIRPKATLMASKLSAVWGILVSLGIATLLATTGSMESPLWGFEELGFSLRLDVLSVIIYSMISLLGYVILNFSINYLDGDSRQGVFLGRLAATLATVQILVISGNLALLGFTWILTSIFLHRLLVFYPERPLAKIAARKKFIVARLSDLTLLIAFGILYFLTGSGNLGAIFSSITTEFAQNPSGLVELATCLLALAAILKSAQFPTHGWLIEVMETPTPVSALLHAGLLNSGPFLIIRMAQIMEVSTYAPLILLGIGGLTAIIATIAYLTQTSIKTALGYSSVGHMGFSLMMSGLGLYSAALVHLVSHSFYKAHAFLSSGSAVQGIQKGKMQSKKYSPNPWQLAFGFILSLGLLGGIGYVFGIDPKQDWGLLFLGGIMILGVFQLLSSGLANSSIFPMVALLSAGLVGVFFILESFTHQLIASQIPAFAEPTTGRIILASGIILISGLVVIAQLLTLSKPNSPLRLAWAIHFRNGLYANAFFDRMVGGLRVPKSTYLLKNEPKWSENESKKKSFEDTLA
ncbi:NAD(P)H-quinone oxidoreductase subunit 5 [Algoriphagus boseongensis]|uniref:Probable inorganic carbon transporter subunit DabB n=1 Tax=Algoriphagus boseongensis TaxID=1442587 RepID=A0A4R6T6S4_9BACT|nr:proton-conducting transporter membrane subunit [Algoriphagus boseongensis]TDQ18311.1 NAD(P)H-quinone oxidoreductase subunit 5 [Algoriphagus boseongensis]